MQIIAPDYYKNFKCIANKCQHSCCIGWEIDIDDETLEIYKNIGGKLGQRLKNSISYNDTPHFLTDKAGRCPFLNQNGLCDIITELGDDGLCQICYDHPRFRNYFSNRMEIGLGLCCEVATELILGSTEKMTLLTLESDGGNELPTKDEKTKLLKRDKLFEVFQNSNITIKSKMEQAARLYALPDTTPDIKALANLHSSLERLDPEWDEYLNSAKVKNPTAKNVLAIAENKIPLPTEQLLCYFTYRYFASTVDSAAAVKFILQSTFFCLAICYSYYGDLSPADFLDICRRYSLEIEYSEENIELLLNDN